MDFKYKHTFEERLNESTKVLRKYPDRIPIICERNSLSKDTPDIDKHKYLVPRNITLGHFITVVRKRIKYGNPNKALFFTINGKLFSNSELFSYVYEFEKDKDGFLYLLYSAENTFG